MPVSAVIFDMDGVLIDSEPFWRQAEMHIFPRVGIQLSEDDCRSTAGLRIDEVVKLWHSRYPWSNYPLEQLTQEILDEVVRLVQEFGEPLSGVYSSIGQVRSAGLKLGLATSSPVRLMNAVLNRLELTNSFDATLSAEGLPFAKPHPEIFLRTAAALGVSPMECLVIEDTINGMVAAKAARMKTIVVPEAANAGDPRFALADHKLQSLEQFHLSSFG
jgi:sugar-phosphatase